MTTPTYRVAIVTGASGGIGAAVAERLAKDGFTVVVNYAGNSASAAAVVARIEAAGGRAVAAQADISDVAAVARMFESTETAFGGVDVLINNAGIMNLAPVADSSDALFDRHIATRESLCTPSSSVCKHWKCVGVGNATRATLSGRRSLNRFRRQVFGTDLIRRSRNDLHSCKDAGFDKSSYRMVCDA